MINRNKIASIVGLVGWQQPTNPSYAIIDEVNTVSLSGYFVNDNAFAKVEYLKDNYDYSDVSDEDFNTFLSNLQINAINSIANQVFNDVDFIDRNVLYKYASNKVNTEVMPVGFVGYRINVTPEKNVAFEISRLFCEFQRTGSLKILLFNSQVSTPIKTKTVEITSNMQTVELGWIIDNTDNYYKGDFYIGYIAINDLTPYARDYDMSNIRSRFDSLLIESCYFPDHTTETLPDLTLRQSNSNCFGLNPDITIYNDYTDLFIQNKRMFAYAVYLECVVKTIETYIGSTRSNMMDRLSKGLASQAMVYLNGQDGDVRIVGIKSLLGKELLRLRDEVKKLQDNYNNTGITVSSIL